MNELERLLDWDVETARLAEMREAVRRRPDYPAAVRRLAANTLADAEADPALDGLLKDAGRTVAGLSAAYLDASGGVTLAGLKQFLNGFGLVSPGRARALLSHMRYLGYVEPDLSRPGRPAIYRLTPRFLASYKRHEASLIDAVQVIEPAAGLVRQNLHVPALLGALVTEQALAFVAGSRQTGPYQAWYGVFMHRLAGIQILHALVAEAEAFPPSRPIRLSHAGLARRFRVSRTHVSRLMEAANSQGFIAVEPGRIVFTAAGCDALDWLYASQLCVHLACAARTLKAHPELTARRAA